MIHLNDTPETPGWTCECRCGLAVCTTCHRPPRIPDNIELGEE